jgi:hypothetical protein
MGWTPFDRKSFMRTQVSRQRKEILQLQRNAGEDRRALRRARSA